MRIHFTCEFKHTFGGLFGCIVPLALKRKYPTMPFSSHDVAPPFLFNDKGQVDMFATKL